MPKTGTSWQPGESGNPAGRPPKRRVLTAMLSRAGAAPVTVNGKRLAGRRWLARALWELVTTGQSSFPDGTAIAVDPIGWFEIVKWIFGQVDGPPRQDLDVVLRRTQSAEELTDDELAAIAAHGSGGGAGTPEKAGG